MANRNNLDHWYKRIVEGKSPEQIRQEKKSTKDAWRMVSALGGWHKVSSNQAFRFYIRVNQKGEKWCFADYRVDDLVSRFHRLEQLNEQGIEPSWKIANTRVLDMTREQLAELED